jgi:hypothetical protein
MERYKDPCPLDMLYANFLAELEDDADAVLTTGMPVTCSSANLFRMDRATRPLSKQRTYENLVSVSSFGINEKSEPVASLPMVK